MVYFILYIFLEVYISVSTFSNIGVLGSFVEIILSAIVGLVLLVNFRYTLGESLMALRNQNITPQAFQALNILTIIGAFLMILPGILSDILGVLMQFGFVSTFIKNRLGISQNQNNFSQNSKRNDDEVIDVEVIDHHNK